MADLFVNAADGSAIVCCFGVPTLLLHTVGCKSGAPRTSALTYGRCRLSARRSRLRPHVGHHERRYSDCQKKTMRPISVVTLTPSR
ncbi:nitroreductase/quinone reductase family protein [Rhodococcus oxybenzonivorans]|uniref:nitroreductase/quinone reductase family protein n=1 Tax=Rhodococcus oxybenzonivorans TaxID=1990687 RepID=UPI001E3004DF|nr:MULTISPECIES: nitroreductase/quinone reductase family protein [Rhodococcus]